MREGRRFILGFLLLATLALLSLSNIPLAYADDADAVVEDASAGGEAVVDATGEVQVEEPETPTEDEDDGSAAAQAAEAHAAAQAAAEAAAAEAAAAARQAAAEAAAAKAAAEASAVVEEETKGGDFVSGVTESAKSKAMAFVDKAKAVTPEQMKKVAAGAVGIWGVAAGAGWVMNNLGGAEE
ncbi:hypothetical protein ACHAXR_012059 [Thalassiosira sp. AJA248-18]